MSETEETVVHVEPEETVARIVAGFLEANGIAVRVVEDDAGDQIPALEATRGVKLVVPAADAERARRLIAERREGSTDEVDG